MVFVARRARSVALRKSLKAAGSGPDLSMERRSLAWNNWRWSILVNRTGEETYSSWPPEGCRGALHGAQSARDFGTTARENVLFFKQARTLGFERISDCRRETRIRRVASC
ncbi:hypothetical protein PO909_007019 [Leuciscus waleckii]